MSDNARTIRNVAAMLDTVQAIAKHIRSVRDDVFREASLEHWINWTENELESNGVPSQQHEPPVGGHDERSAAANQQESATTRTKLNLTLKDVALTRPPSYNEDSWSEVPDDLSPFIPSSPFRDNFGSVYEDPYADEHNPVPFFEHKSVISMGLRAARELTEVLHKHIEAFPSEVRFTLDSAISQYWVWFDHKSLLTSIPAHGFVAELNEHYVRWKKIADSLLVEDSPKNRGVEYNTSNPERTEIGNDGADGSGEESRDTLHELEAAKSASKKLISDYVLIMHSQKPDAKPKRGRSKLATGESTYKEIIRAVLKEYPKDVITLTVDELAETIGCHRDTVIKNPDYKEFKKTYNQPASRMRLMQPEISEKYILKKKRQADDEISTED